MDRDGAVHLGDTGEGLGLGGAEGDQPVAVSVGHVFTAGGVDGDAAEMTAVD
jgi:hypothetical protein